MSPPPPSPFIFRQPEARWAEEYFGDWASPFSQCLDDPPLPSPLISKFGSGTELYILTRTAGGDRESQAFSSQGFRNREVCLSNCPW